jgi:hypothetical protein
MSNFKLLYEQMKKLVDAYQNEVVPGLLEQIEQKWIPISERPPEYGERVIVFCRSKAGKMYKMHTTIATYYGGVFSRGVRDVTHWRPLPPDPKEGE